MSWVKLKASGTSTKVQIPWIVMTSDATDSATRIYFEEKAYFGLEKSQARLALNPKPTLIVVSEFWMKSMLWYFEVPSHSEIQVVDGSCFWWLWSHRRFEKVVRQF